MMHAGHQSPFASASPIFVAFYIWHIDDILYIVTVFLAFYLPGISFTFLLSCSGLATLKAFVTEGFLFVSNGVCAEGIWGERHDFPEHPRSTFAQVEQKSHGEAVSYSSDGDCCRKLLRQANAAAVAATKAITKPKAPLLTITAYKDGEQRCLRGCPSPGQLVRKLRVLNQRCQYDAFLQGLLSLLLEQGVAHQLFTLKFVASAVKQTILQDRGVSGASATFKHGNCACQRCVPGGQASAKSPGIFEHTYHLGAEGLVEGCGAKEHGLHRGDLRCVP